MHLLLERHLERTASLVRSSNAPRELHELHVILCLCWREGKVPQDMREANTVTLYKNKGDRSDSNNYRGISLLSIVGKLFARVVLKRLQALAEKVYPESQCGSDPRGPMCHGLLTETIAREM